MALTSPISPYSDLWPDMFEAEKTRLEHVFGGTARIHHVDSTAVPGLAAKPEVDLLVAVERQGDTGEVQQRMRGLGYLRGKDLSGGHHFYRRDVDRVRTHKVHVCSAGHARIGRMLRFRDLLRQDPDLRARYRGLKLTPEAENREYLAQKATFIDAVLGFGET